MWPPFIIFFSHNTGALLHNHVHTLRAGVAQAQRFFLGWFDACFFFFSLSKRSFSVFKTFCFHQKQSSICFLTQMHSMSPWCLILGLWYVIYGNPRSIVWSFVHVVMWSCDHVIMSRDWPQTAFSTPKRKSHPIALSQTFRGRSALSFYSNHSFVFFPWLFFCEQNYFWKTKMKIMCLQGSWSLWKLASVPPAIIALCETAILSYWQVGPSSVPIELAVWEFGVLLVLAEAALWRVGRLLIRPTLIFLIFYQIYFSRLEPSLLSLIIRNQAPVSKI